MSSTLTSTSTSTSFYIYDQEDIRFETDENGTIIAEYTHGPEIDEPLAMRRNGINYYYHVNGLGSVVALTDSTKAVVQSYVYDSFGQIISQSGSITNPYTFTGREYDPEIGMYYYRARYYDARMGRFISEDPILKPLNIVTIGSSTSKLTNQMIWYLPYLKFSPQSLHLYAYVGNNSVNFTDPLGLLYPPPSIIFPLPGKCLDCEWGALWSCIWNIGYDPGQGMACLLCIIKGDIIACEECFAPPLIGIGECFSKHCRTSEPDECGNCI